MGFPQETKTKAQRREETCRKELLQFEKERREKRVRCERLAVRAKAAKAQSHQAEATRPSPREEGVIVLFHQVAGWGFIRSPQFNWNVFVNRRELYRIMEFVRNMERRRLIKPQDILATLQSIPEDESESELQEHVFDSDSDEDFIPQNISSESEDSEGTNPEDIPSTSTGDRAHAVILPRDHPPGRGQKKSAKRPRNERTTDNDGGEGNATTNTREGESEGILVSADGIQWKPVEIGEHLPGRRDSQNILREAPGPTEYARRNIIIDSPLSAWRLFFDSYILTHIKNCTLAEACRNNNLQFTLSDEELDAFIAIFYARGISGTNRHSISSIWCNDWGIPFCKATMSRDRFVEIMRFLRFDEKSTRSERLQTDKFALFSTVWDRFIENCIACYKPGPYITVDEQLFPSKTRCPFKQDMPSKPDKYGHKYWLAVDKRSKYLANGFPYLGKDDTRRAEDRLADHVVMKLLDPFLKKGCNVTTDNYFTSVKLAKQLKSKGTTIVGTLNKIRREVPKEIKSMKEELYNTKVFRNEDNFTLTVYQGKPNTNVVILSSVHPDVVVARREFFNGINIWVANIRCMFFEENVERHQKDSE
ncbi:uncharacterized protein [Phyllobates terribilis]|uniref:uncharacterized protein n=1 Tax=Phyllobates terribilis TaxID=111132 RepID=UPI003CCB044A